jgi:uncharacterized protein (TIGR02246 family)
MKANGTIENRIIAVMDKLTAAHAKKDIDTIVSLFVKDDAVVIGTDRKDKRIGLNEIRQQMESDFQESDVIQKIELKDIRVSSSGNVAWLVADRNNITNTASVKYRRLTVIFVNHDDNWLIAQWHCSAPRGE